MKTFTPLVVTTKFFNYSLPLNMDSYRYCSFQCEYCFMKNRVIGKRNEHLKPNISWLDHKFKKVYDDKEANSKSFIDTLLKNKITINFGTKSDPFQPAEFRDCHTQRIVSLCNEYDLTLSFATKSDTYYNVDVSPDNHVFQLSITNHYNDKFLEPNVPSFERKVDFYKQLKDEGFKVGIRFEPFIPNITDMRKCLSYFDDVDHVHISRLRLLPQIDNKNLLNYIRCSKEDFSTRGLTSLKGDVWYSYVKPTLDFLDENGYSYSTSFIHIGNCDFLGGNSLNLNTIPFDTFHLKEKYGSNWTMNDGLNEMGEYKDCNCYNLFTSNRRNGCKTVEEFYRDRWGKPTTTFAPENQFKPKNTTLFDF